MLTFNQIQNIYKGSEPRNDKARLQLVEYIQHELLDSIFKQAGSEKLNFMGGTAIRIAYGGNRFSEDLDFDNNGLSFDEFKELLEMATRDMKGKGFKIEFRFVEKDAFHCHIHLPLLLYKNALTPHLSEKILIKVDTMQNNPEVTPNIFLLKKFDLYRPIRVNSPDVLLAQKLVAIHERKREKGRDFYDVSFLYGFAKPDFKYIEQALHLSKEKFISNIIERCQKLDFKSLAKDVEPFLIVPDQASRVLTFLEFIKTHLNS